MKFLLAVLLSFIMTEAPVLALQGGYTLNGSTSLIGSYAGILVPISDNLLVATATDFGANSLGLFTLSLSQTGLGAGSVVIFSNGRTFDGSIQALPDPANPGSIVGIVNATFSYTLNLILAGTAGQTTATQSLTANAQGSFDASAVNNPQSVGGLGVDLDGSSEINIDQGFVSGSSGTPIVVEQVTFAIDGFQQSTTGT